MATSLEELLAKEGFRGKRSMLKSRPSFGSDAAVARRPRGQANTDAAYGTRLKVGRSQSDASHYGLKSNSFSRGETSKGSRQRDSPVTREVMRRERHRVTVKTTETSNTRETRRYDPGHVDDSGEEITEEATENIEKIKDMYLNEMRESPRKDKQVKGREGRYQRDNTLQKEMKFDDTPERNTLRKGQSDHPNDSSSGGSSSMNRKNNEHVRAENHAPSVLVDSIPALDEAAIQATISILTSYCKRFLQDEVFRTSISDHCFSSLNFIEPEKCPDSESKVIFNLMEAIETVEKATIERANSIELKRAALQLTVITGLNSSELMGGFICGVPNYKLSACAHLYLSVIYKLQKKNRVSAKHLLQVFCDSPFQARTALLPELWENFFYPHLSHLELWYNQEVDSLVDASNKERKLKLLNKVFKEILDSGTYQFAIYYKNWLMEGFEPPSVPSINTPSLSFHGVQLEGAKVDIAENFLSSMTDPGSPSPETKRTSTSSSETIKHVDERSVENTMKDETSVIGDQLLEMAAERKDLQEVSFSMRGASDEESGNLSVWQQATTGDYSVQVPSTHLTESSYSFEEQSQFPTISAERALSMIEQAFVCPLTRQLFRDPVTLFTGQTYERAAIAEWFDQGNETCPVTGTTLKSLNVPRTNFFIKQAVEILMSYERKNEMDSISNNVGLQKEDGIGDSGKEGEALSVLEMLLNLSDKEERSVNAKRLVSLGGLHYLIQKVEFGPLPEKIHAAELLLCCIEADARCRNDILEGLNRNVLLELLHTKQSQGRSIAVSLLTELICMTRRKDSVAYFSGLLYEEMMNTMHTLLLYLRSSPREEKSMVAVLLLHLDLLVESCKFSIYREEAVNAISLALELSCDDEKIRANCCKSLTTLGRRFLSATKLYPETDTAVLHYMGSAFETTPGEEAHDLFIQPSSSAGEESASRNWAMNLLLSLLGSGKKSFVDAISRCLRSDDVEFTRACLTTVACLSFALPSLSESDLQLSAFSTLLPLLKEKLENGDHVQDKILASTALLNFSRVSECREALTTIAEEIASPLRRISDTTWTAKRLHAIISRKDS